MDNFLRYLKWIVPLFVFIVLLFFLWQGLYLKPHHIPSPLINKALPEFKIISLKNDQDFITNRDFIGKITMLNVFATWCISCQVEHPALMDIARRNRVVIYGLDYKDDRIAVRRWLHGYGNPYEKVLFDSTGELGIDLGVYGTPETFIIDQKGIIRYKYIGPINLRVWQDKLLPEIEKLAA